MNGSTSPQHLRHNGSRAHTLDGAVAALHPNLDAGIEHILSVRALLRAFSLSPTSLLSIEPNDFQEIILLLLSEVDSAHEQLSSLIPTRK